MYGNKNVCDHLDCIIIRCNTLIINCFDAVEAVKHNCLLTLQCLAYMYFGLQNTYMLHLKAATQAPN